MTEFEAISIAGAMNAPAFIARANELAGGGVDTFEQAAQFFQDIAYVDSPQSVVELLSMVFPAKNQPQLRKVGLSSIGDAIAVLLGYQTSQQAEAQQALIEAQQALLNQPNANAGKSGGVPGWVWPVGIAAVVVAFFVLRK